MIKIAKNMVRMQHNLLDFFLKCFEKVILSLSLQQFQKIFKNLGAA